MAHIVITYFLWLFGGWVGLHHFYLGRDRQAFVWWATWGGCFGLGWIRDLWRIPEYIFYANEDNGYLEEYKERTKRYKAPPFCVTRFAGEMVMGYVLGMLVRLSMPEEYTTDGIGPFLAVFLPPIAVAIGVHTVANIQPQNSEIKWPLIGAFCGLPWLLYDSQNLMYSSIISAIVTNWKGKQWDLKRRKRRGFCCRVSTLTFWGTLYLSFWVSTIYFNASVTTRAGDTIPLREAIPNFINSPAWAEMKESLKHFYEYYQIHGFEKLWEEIIEKLDPIGETRAFKVLGLEQDATEKEIKDRYRKLAREWHPDKEKDPKKKAKAQEKFVEIQKAYETLSKIKSKRARKNRADRVKEEHSWRYSSDD